MNGKAVIDASDSEDENMDEIFKHAAQKAKEDKVARELKAKELLEKKNEVGPDGQKIKKKL
jgi:hypothetical protein